MERFSTQFWLKIRKYGLKVKKSTKIDFGILTEKDQSDYLLTLP